MRIRKNKKLSPLMFPQGSRPDGVHVCRLNQSMWDVVPLSPEPFLHHRFEYEDSFNGNGSTGDSIGAVESVATMLGSKEEGIMKVGGTVIDDNDDNNEIKTPEQFGFESQCEEEDKESNQEPALLKSCNNSSSGDSGNNINPVKKDENYNNQPTVSRRGRSRTSRRGSSSASNPYEFYYYSGFGPSWGKKRRGGNKVKGLNRNLHIEPEEVENNGSVITAQNNSAPSSSSQIDDNEELDYEEEEEEEEDDENGDSSKKRIRKPIKARSLKSLM